MSSSYQPRIISYRGRSWLGVGKALVSGYQLVGGWPILCEKLVVSLQNKKIGIGYDESR